MSLLSALAARRNPKSKGILKRYQETVELLNWKYSESVWSVEEELKDVVSMPQLINVSKFAKVIKVPWTSEDKDLIAEKCRNKTFEETFEIETEKENLEISEVQNEVLVPSQQLDEIEAMSVDEESSKDDLYMEVVQKYSEMFLHSSLHLNGNKMKPLFENKQTNFILAELIGLERNVSHKIRGNPIRAHSMFPPVKSKILAH